MNNLYVLTGNEKSLQKLKERENNVEIESLNRQYTNEEIEKALQKIKDDFKNIPEIKHNMEVLNME